VTLPPQQTNNTTKSPTDLTRASDEEMMDNALTVTCQAMNASTTTTSSNQTPTNKQKVMNITLFNPWKMITTTKQNGNTVQTCNTITMIKDPLLKL